MWTQVSMESSCKQYMKIVHEVFWWKGRKRKKVEKWGEISKNRGFQTDFGTILYYFCVLLKYKWKHCFNFKTINESIASTLKLYYQPEFTTS